VEVHFLRRIGQVGLLKRVVQQPREATEDERKVFVSVQAAHVVDEQVVRQRALPLVKKSDHEIKRTVSNYLSISVYQALVAFERLGTSQQQRSKKEIHLRLLRGTRF
jgi:hypothetical protein